MPPLTPVEVAQIDLIISTHTLTEIFSAMDGRLNEIAERFDGDGIWMRRLELMGLMLKSVLEHQL